VRDSNCGAMSAIRLVSTRDNASAKAFSLVEAHLASRSKSNSVARRRYLRKTCIDAPRILRLVSPC